MRMNNFLRSICVAAAALALSACPKDDPESMAVTLGGTMSDGLDSSGDDGGDDGDDDGGEGACILNNCSSDAECSDCTDGRNTCLQSESRCVQCDPGGDGSECADGEKCTEFGNCVPGGQRLRVARRTILGVGRENGQQQEHDACRETAKQETSDRHIHSTCESVASISVERYDCKRQPFSLRY